MPTIFKRLSESTSPGPIAVLATTRDREVAVLPTLRPGVRGVQFHAQALFLLRLSGVGVKRLDDLVAFREAVAFKNEVYTIVRGSALADRDYRYRDQLFDAASSIEANIAEGWRRFGAADLIRFLRYAAGSLEEARVRLLDGVDRGYFGLSDCESALAHAGRCGAATTNLIKSLQRLKG